MKKLYPIILLVLAAWTVASCVYDYDPQIEGEGGYLVVEGNLVVGDYSEISTGWSWSLVDTTQDAERWKILASNKMHVEASNGTRYENLYGTYTPTLGRFDLRNADPSLEYRLVIENTKGTYATVWTKPLSPGTIDSLSFRVSDDEERLEILVATHGDSETGSYYRWSVSETWEYNADVYAEYKYDVESGEVVPQPYEENLYHCWTGFRRPDILLGSTTDLREDRLIDYELYTVSKHDERISVLYAADVLQMRIPEEAWRYWQMMKRNSSDVGGLFSPEPSELRGNIVCETHPQELVLGYVGVMSVATQRLYIDNSKIHFYRSIRPALPDADTLNTRDQYKEAYSLFKLPTQDVLNLEGLSEIWLGYAWYPSDCVDCRRRGGTKTKPEGWPNTDL